MKLRGMRGREEPGKAKRLFYLKFKQEVFLNRQESGKEMSEQRLEAEQRREQLAPGWGAGAELVVLEKVAEHLRACSEGTL